MATSMSDVLYNALLDCAYLSVKFVPSIRDTHPDQAMPWMHILVEQTHKAKVEGAEKKYLG